MDYFSKISQQTIWQLLGKLVTSFSTFIILGFVTRAYGKEGTGIFTMALTYLAMFYLLADFGFNAHVLSKLQGSGRKVQDEWNKLFGTRILWSIFLVLISVVLFPLLPFATPELTTAVFVGSLAVIASGIYTTCNLVFQSKLRYDLSVLASIIGTVLSLPVFLFLYTNNFPVPYLLLSHLFGWFTIALGSIILVSKFYKKLRPVFNLNYSTGLFKQSWLIAATLALNVIYFRIDSFMVAYFVSISDAGLYNIAYSVFQSALVLPTFIMNSYYPLMLNSTGRLRFMVAGLLGLSVLGTLITLVLSPFLINILAGGGFDGSVSSLKILSLGFPAYFLSALLMWVFIKKGKYKQLFLLYTSMTLFNIIANLIFIPKFSFIAASWITVFSEYLILILQVMVLWLDQRQNYLKE